MKRQHTILGLIAAACACFLSSCASNPNPTYASAKASLTPEPGKGLVLIYYKDGITGKAGRLKISANDQLLTDKFRRGSFYSYQAPPGPLALTTAVKPTYVPIAIALQALAAIPIHYKPFQVEANQTYYLPLKAGAFMPKLEPVSKEEGERDIQNCHWVNPAGN